MNTSLLTEASESVRPLITLAVETVKLFEDIKIFLSVTEKRDVCIYPLAGQPDVPLGEIKALPITTRDTILDWQRDAHIDKLYFEGDELETLPAVFLTKRGLPVRVESVPVDADHEVMMIFVLAVDSPECSEKADDFIALLTQQLTQQLKWLLGREQQWSWLEDVWYEARQMRTKADLFTMIVYAVQLHLDAHAAAMYPYDYLDSKEATEPYLAHPPGTKIPETSIAYRSMQPEEYGRVTKPIAKQGYLFIPSVTAAMETGDIGERTAQTCADLGAAAFVGLRLNVRKKPKGLLFIYYKDENPPVDRITLEAFARHVAFVLETTWRRTHLHRIINMMEGVIQFANSMAGDTEELLRLIANRVKNAFGASAAVCFAYDQRSGSFSLPGGDSIKDRDALIVALHDPAYLPLGEHLQRNIEFHNTQYEFKADDPKLLPIMSAVEFFKREAAQAAALIPLGVKKHKVGILYLLYRKPHRFTTDEEADVRALAQFLGVILQQNLNFRGLVTTSDSLSGRALQRWYSEIANSWGHEVTRLASNIQMRAEYLRESYPQITEEQDMLFSEILEQAGAITDLDIFSAPLEIEEQAGEIAVNAFLRERIRQIRNRSTFHALNIIFDSDIDDSTVVMTSSTWLRWSIDIILKTIRGYVEERATIRIITRQGRHKMVRIEFHYRGKALSSKFLRMLNSESAIIDPEQKMEGMDLLLAKTVLKSYNGSIKGSSGLDEQQISIEFLSAIYHD